MAENNGQVENGAQESGAQEITLDSFNAEQRAWIEAQIASNADRRVNQAQAKWKKDAERKQSLSGLDGEARAKAEVEQRLADLEAENLALRTTQRTAEVKSVLASHGIDASIGDLLKIEDDENANLANIKKLETAINKMVSKAVKDRMPASNVGGSGSSGAPLTRETFAKLSIKEQMNIYNTDRALYDALSK